MPGDPVNFDGPDNITVSPHGGLILAEDGSGIQHLIGVSRGGTAYPMARNQRNNSERKLARINVATVAKCLNRFREIKGSEHQVEPAPSLTGELVPIVGNLG